MRFTATKHYTMIGSLLLVGILTSMATSQAVVSSASLSIEPYSFIVPNVTDVTQGANARFTFDPKGGIHIAYQSGDSSTNLYYISNSTGEWGTPEMIHDPQGGVLWPDIAVDSQCNVHIASPHDWGGGSYLTNNSGDWTAVSMNGRYSPQIAVSNDGTAHIIYHSIKLSTNNFLGLTYWNSSANFPLTGIRDNNTNIRFEQNPDVAVDSAGKIHAVFEGSWNNTLLGNIAVLDIYYATLDPYAQTPAFTPAVKISSVGATSNSARYPQIYCDGSDQIHIGWVETKTMVENGLNVNRAFIHYLNYTAGNPPGSVQTVNTVRTPGSIADLAVDSNGKVHFAYLGLPQDVYYCTNEDGTWAEQRVTNQPSWLTIPQIAIHPITDAPVLLLIQPNGYGIERMMQIMEMVNGEFGTKFDGSAQLSGDPEHLTAVQQETSSFIELTQGEACNMTVTISNPQAIAQNLSLQLEFVPHVAIELTGGTQTRSLASLAPGGSSSLVWAFQGISTQSTTVTVLLKADGRAIGELTFSLNIASVPIAIPGFTAGVLALCSVISILALSHKNRRALNHR